MIIRGTLLFILCCISLVWTKPVLAMSDADKAVWGASEKVDTSFVVPHYQGPSVMGKAQGLVSQWGSYDSGMTPMKIQTVTDNLIETYNPIEIGNVGFTVTRTVLPEGDQISVSTSYYAGNLFSAGRDRKDANKRAHLLSYVLQTYAKTLTEPPVTPAPAIIANKEDNLPELPEDLAAYFKIIHLQLSQGKYDLALTSLEGLRSMIADKQKSSSQTNPVSVAPISSGTATAKPTTVPDNSLKPTPVP